MGELLALVSSERLLHAAFDNTGSPPQSPFENTTIQTLLEASLVFNALPVVTTESERKTSKAKLTYLTVKLIGLRV